MTKLISGISFLIFVIIPLFSEAQVKLDLEVTADTLSVNKYKANAGSDKNILHLRMAYGRYKIINPHTAKKLKGQKVSKVKLIYTDYPQGVDMERLNNFRVLSLYFLAPQLFNNDNIQWEYVKQTGASNFDVYNFFHGFAIEYQKEQVVDEYISTKEYFRAIIEGKEKVSDSTVLKVFERNDDWNDILVVGDFTGSMEPYIAEVMLWHHLSFDKNKNRAYVFFNDGDSKPDNEKKIGKTGGIYTYSGNDIDKLIDTAIKTVEAGSGGDIQENDIEAILYGIEKYPELETVVLIADNWSNMRDFEIYEKIDRPVKVILCGMNRVINLQYLNLAYKTGGSVHTIEQDLTDLLQLKEGETIRINDVIYTIKNGEFLSADEI
jgi:hypothetical protein